MSFHDVRFPVDIAFSTSGGPERRVEVVELANGYEERNALWAASRRRYDAGLGLRDDDDLHAVIAFFEARGGKLHAFRWRDWLDWKSCPPLATISPRDQVIGTGDGVTVSFTLSKTYVSGAQSWTRAITKPVAGTVRVAVAGVEQLAGVTLAPLTGVVGLPAAPPAGAVVTAGFAFDVPVRFDVDQLSFSLSDWRAGHVPSIPLVEVRS